MNLWKNYKTVVADVFPDIKFLFEVFIIIEKIIYNLLNLLLLTKFTHFKINLIIKKN